jgi:hypothetical protein
MTAPDPEPVEFVPRSRPIVSYKELLLQLVIVTAGVLIALLLESLLEWNHYRNLVVEARQMIAREIADNKKEIESVLASSEPQTKNIEGALRLANDLLASGKSEIRQVDLGVTLADLSTASWQSAERTGAVAHMDYAEVQEYSRLYGVQDLFAAQQRRGFERLTQAIGILGHGSPHDAPPRDIEAFRQHLLALRADLHMVDQLAMRLNEDYQRMLER